MRSRNANPSDGTIEKKVYSIEDTMEALSLGRTTVFSLVTSGELRSVKIGRRRMITAAALDEYVAKLDQSH